MTAACVAPLPLYRPRDPQASDLWRLLDQHFETFQQVYDERLACGDRVLSGSALLGPPDADAPFARMAHGRTQPEAVASGADAVA